MDIGILGGCNEAKQRKGGDIILSSMGTIPKLKVTLSGMGSNPGKTFGQNCYKFVNYFGSQMSTQLNLWHSSSIF